MEIKKLDENTVDVFTGQGWENWTRFTIKRNKGKAYLTKIAGKPMDADDFKQLCQQLAQGLS